MRYLIDTNVISELRKSARSKVVMDWLTSNSVEDMWTSTANLAELEYGAAVHPDFLHRKSIEVWISETVRPWFATRIVPPDERSLLRWLILLKQAQKLRSPAPHVDLLVAAMALDKGLIVATRDVDPFVATGVPTLNPWTGERFNGA